MKYFSLYLLELKNSAHFRSNLYAWILSHPLQLMIIYWIWKGIFQFTDSFVGMSLNEVLAYYFIVHFITCTLSSAFSVNYLVWSDINEGTLDRYICRPLNYLTATTYRSLAEPSIELLIALPTLAISLYLVDFKLQVATLFIFATSLILAALIVIEIQKLIGLMTFWFEKIFAIRDIIFSIFMLLSGQLVPLAALPNFFMRAAEWMPFEAIYHIPTSLFMNSLDTRLTLFLLAKQLIWLILLRIAVHFGWNRGIPHYTSQGG